MTNETKEQTQSRGRLLVIDDNPNYALNAIRAARARGYEVDVAFDLKGAMSYLQSGSYTGVITDLQFFEEGVKEAKTLANIDQSLRLNLDEPLSDLEKSLLEPIQTKTEIKSNSELRERIARELATPEYAHQLASLRNGAGRLKDLFFGDESSESLQRSLMESPAMGYEIIKYAQEHDIPFAVVSSVGHGQQCIPALLQTRLADVESIIRHESIRYSERQKIEEEREKFSDPIFEKEMNGTLKGNELKAEYRKCNAIFDPKLARLNALVLDRAILVMQEGKEQHTYDFAVDILEGKIDQTRPYKVEA